jgi:hypothetical protein
VLATSPPTLRFAVMFFAHQMLLAEKRSTLDENRSASLSCYVLDGGIPLPTVDVKFYFCLHHDVQAGTETHLASYSMESGNFILGVKRPELEADNRPVELRVESLITLSLPFYRLTQ